MSVQMNDLQIMYNTLSVFLFDNFKKIRKDFKKEIRKIYEYKQNLNKDIYNIVNDIINNSSIKKSMENINVNIDNKLNPKDGYKYCLKQRTKNRGLCKKVCKIEEEGCFFHKNNVTNNKQLNLNNNFKDHINENKMDFMDLKINYKKEHRRNKIYIPSGINKNKDLDLSKNLNFNINFPTIQQTQTPGQYYKKNNRLYTINYYNKEVIVDAPNGINCYNCSTPRYTISGPCINYNCKK